MIKQITIIMIALLLIVNVVALNSTNNQTVKLCKVVYDIKDATEIYTTIFQTPIMENKTVYSNLTNFTAFAKALSDYNKLTDKTKSIRPVLISYVVQVPKTIQVQKTITKTKFYIDWQNFKIGTKTITTPQYNIQNITKQRIKSGYNFDEDTGEFWRNEKC